MLVKIVIIRFIYVVQKYSMQMQEEVGNMMNTDELLQAINVMLDEKLRETEHNLKDYIDQRLHDSENMILNEVDRVQEKNNEKFNNLKFQAM